MSENSSGTNDKKDYTWYAGGTEPEKPAADGEYSYENREWSDAHYIPVGQDAVPPHYYTPQAKPEKPAKDARKHGHGGKIAVTALLCVLCILAGAVGGALLAEYCFAGRVATLEEQLLDTRLELNTAEQSLATAGEDINGLETSVASLEEELEQVNSSAQRANTYAAAAEGISAGEIYTRACEQVVGITTEVTYTNFFGQTSSSAVSGTGFVVSADGYILTNYHVIEYAYLYNHEITVITYDGTRYHALIAGVEEDNDLAVLKVEASGLKAASMADSDNIRVGDAVYAVGNPLGELDFTMTAGRVSALGRVITTGDNEVPVKMFQFDAAVNSGNSGGPLYNAFGEVIGVVTAKYSESGVEGLGFAIPADDASAIAEQLIAKGYVSGKACLGVQLDSRYTAVYSRYYGTPLGAYVYFVETGSAAADAGLQAGDIITALGGNEIHDGKDLSAVLRSFAAGETGSISVYRAGQVLTLEVTFGEAGPGSARGTTY